MYQGIPVLLVQQTCYVGGCDTSPLRTITTTPQATVLIVYAITCGLPCEFCRLLPLFPVSQCEAHQCTQVQKLSRIGQAPMRPFTYVHHQSIASITVFLTCCILTYKCMPQGSKGKFLVHFFLVKSTKVDEGTKLVITQFSKFSRC